MTFKLDGNMMTPTAILEFNFELLFANGDKIRTEAIINKHGAFDASEWLKVHGVELSYSTILNSHKERMYKVTRLPWNAADTEQDAIKVFDKAFGWDGHNVVDVHICFKRISLKEYCKNN